MELGTLIKTKRKQLGLTLASASTLLSISASYLSLIEGGKKSPSLRVLRQVSSIFSVPEIELFRLAGVINDDGGNEKGDPLERLGKLLRGSLESALATVNEQIELLRGFRDAGCSPEIPLWHSIPAGKADPVSAEKEPDGYISIAPSVLASDPGAYALVVKGDSMHPEVQDGDIVVISPRTNSAWKDGDIVAITYNGYEHTLKRIFDAGTHLILNSTNPAYLPLAVSKDDEIRIWGKMVQLIRNY